jgi:predicted lipoprotein with Yx(FWY)xxD motif
MSTRFPREAVWVAAAFITLLAVARFYGSPHPEADGDALSLTPLATPPGITLQLRSSGGRARVATAAEWVFADSRGMSLYTHGKGPSRSADCEGDCTATWPPFLASPSSETAEDWSLLPRTDGTRQWVYRGAPLYRFAKDKAIGDTGGEGADGGAWHAAVFRPEDGVALPDAVAIREITDAGGMGLVDYLGMTLYTYEGNVAQSKAACAARACAQLWMPLEAPGIANSVGRFTAVTRDDGISQWIYQGKPLFKFAGDQRPGDVNGAGVDPRFRVALILRFFMPDGVAIHRNIELGDILATRRGATLYQRDRVTMQELHPFRTDHGSPSLGRALGTSTCDESCARTWPPLLASHDALSSGFWDVIVRPNGTRQWAYKGFAMYTYAPEKPGDISGNGIYTLARIDGSGKPAGSTNLAAADIDPNLFVGGAAAGLGVSALFWHAVVP